MKWCQTRSPNYGLRATSSPPDCSFRPTSSSHMLCSDPFQTAQGEKARLYSPLFGKESRTPMCVCANQLEGFWMRKGETSFPLKFAPAFSQLENCFLCRGWIQRAPLEHSPLPQPPHKESPVQSQSSQTRKRKLAGVLWWLTTARWAWLGGRGHCCQLDGTHLVWLTRSNQVGLAR